MLTELADAPEGRLGSDVLADRLGVSRRRTTALIASLTRAGVVDTTPGDSWLRTIAARLHRVDQSEHLEPARWSKRTLSAMAKRWGVSDEQAREILDSYYSG
jgi:DNA-binding IclR family transcriptional regulator